MRELGIKKYPPKYKKEDEKRIAKVDSFGIAYGANGHLIPEDFTIYTWCKNCVHSEEPYEYAHWYNCEIKPEDRINYDPKGTDVRRSNCGSLLRVYQFSKCNLFENRYKSEELKYNVD